MPTFHAVWFTTISDNSQNIIYKKKKKKSPSQKLLNNQTTLHLVMENCSDEFAINMICYKMQGALTSGCKSQHRVISNVLQQASEAFPLQGSHQSAALSSPLSWKRCPDERERRKEEPCTPGTVSLQHSGHAGPSAIPTPAQC